MGKSLSWLFGILQGWYLDMGAGIDSAFTLTVVSMWILAAALIVAIYFIVTGPGDIIMRKAADRTSTRWDNHMLNRRMMCGAGIFLSSAAAYFILPQVAAFHSSEPENVVRFCKVAVIAGAVVFLNIFISSFYRAMLRERVELHGMTVVRNILQTIITSVAVLLILSVILSRDITYVLSGLGALAAVLMVVFKDSILGMTAGVRLVVNHMLRLNDWIIVPSYNADGRVTDITLTAVIVRNWDNSVSNIPPHALLSEGFRNMQSMVSRGSRQIRQVFYIDASSVRVLSEEEMHEVKAHFPEIGAAVSKVNLTLWRGMLRNILEKSPDVAHSELSIVRELQPSDKGVPVEVIFFIEETEWRIFEETKADMLDYIVSTLHVFRLRIFQSPSGGDIAAMPFSRR